MENIKPLKWINFLWLFGLPTLLNFIACQIAIPFMVRNTLLPIEIIYFICVGGIALACHSAFIQIEAKKNNVKISLSLIRK